MKFAVIIPTYNRSNLIQNAISSVLQQSYDDWDIYIVDDHSDFEHRKNIENLLKKLSIPNIYYYYLNENKGHCYARNYALQKIAETNVPTWIKYLDDDDTILPQCLEILNDAIDNHTKIITTQFCIIKDNETTVEGADFSKQPILMSDDLDTCSICHDIQCFKEIGGWDEYLYRMADDDFFYKYIPHYQHQYKFVPQITSIFNEVNTHKRVSNKEGNYKYLNHIASKYDARFDQKILFVYNTDKGKQKFLNNDFITCDYEYTDLICNNDILYISLSDFLNNYMERYDYIILYYDNDDINKIYKNKQKCYQIGNSYIICKKNIIDILKVRNKINNYIYEKKSRA